VQETQTGILAWLHCPRTGSRNLWLFTAYFDDSGTNPKHRVGALAGFAASIEEWSQFEAEWGQLVADPKVRYFKAHDCDKGDGLYRDVPEGKRREVYDRALQIICRHSLIPIALAGRRQDFEGEWAKYWRPGFAGSGFQMSVRSGFISLALVLGNKRINDRVALICEDGKRRDNETVTHGYHSIVGADQSCEIEGRFMGPPAFHRKEDFYGLQAADMLAYEVGIEYARRTDGKDIPPRDGWLRLLEHGRQNGGVLRLMTRQSSATFGFGDEDCGI
jgi:hypothetical protein